MKAIDSHPGRVLWAWLKQKRQAQGIISRDFAHRIGLSPAQYCEVEEGITHWIQGGMGNQSEYIPWQLHFTPDEHNEFVEMWKAARSANPLKFDDIFTRDELRPMHVNGGKRLTKEQEERLLDTVFTPLPIP